MPKNSKTEETVAPAPAASKKTKTPKVEAEEVEEEVQEVLPVRFHRYAHLPGKCLGR